MVSKYMLKVTGRPGEPEFVWMHGGPKGIVIKWALACLSLSRYPLIDTAGVAAIGDALRKSRPRRRGTRLVEYG